jgi:uncharacterized protein (TIGR02246 family)
MMKTEIRLSSSDEAAIRSLLERMRDAWQSGDGEAYGSTFSEDARYVTAPGERLVGRKAIADSHQRIFNTLLKDTHLGRTYPAAFQAIAPGVVLIHSSGAVLFEGETETHVQPNGLMTLVAANQNGNWQIVSFNNTQTGRMRNVKFLWRFLMSRTWWPFRAEWSKAKRYMLEEKKKKIERWKGN